MLSAIRDGLAWVVPKDEMPVQAVNIIEQHRKRSSRVPIMAKGRPKMSAKLGIHPPGANRTATSPSSHPATARVTSSPPACTRYSRLIKGGPSVFRVNINAVAVECPAMTVPMF